VTISKLKTKLQEELKTLPLPVLQEIEALVKERMKAREVEEKEYRKFGSLSGLQQYMATDFNAPLSDFEDYR
jgi:hypothetical protein